MQKIGEKIKILIRQNGLSVGELADQIGYNRTALSRAINQDPVPDRLVRVIATHFNIAESILYSDVAIKYGDVTPKLQLPPDAEPPDDEELELRVEVERLRKQVDSLIKTNAKLIDLLNSPD